MNVRVFRVRLKETNTLLTGIREELSRIANALELHLQYSYGHHVTPQKYDRRGPPSDVLYSDPLEDAAREELENRGHPGYTEGEMSEMEELEKEGAGFWRGWGFGGDNED